ncbi:DUF1173 domain-containing protein [Xinfangfangia sp. D13-10-4-6]|uniref:DUF1173 family protein n=1 Tax=Pseudogemmobacter hezensis TaxID=2737662 RepID=UPI0015571602|nr:DUF1173 family protein [Pseudogemmobacter hezensis]NPD15022.1 DUF1173 domain-containing protein [Pseudogemmobacter hezensis]
MRRFDINGTILKVSAPEFQKALERAWQDRIRPLCLCRKPGVPTYIAKIGGQYLVKRMPLSGESHDPGCEAFEPQWSTSALDTLIGNAIRRDDATGRVSLKLGFGLAKTGTRNPGNSAPAIPGVKSSVVMVPPKLSLAALLHLLWHEADLTRWTANWAGKRYWWTVRSHLIAASRTMMVRGETLASLLFIPETFRLEAKSEIEQRRMAALLPLQPGAGGQGRLMLMLGEVKSIDTSRLGRKIILRHLPDFPLLIDDRSWSRVQTLFANELSLWEADESSHLILFATFGLNPAGLASVEEIVLMVCTTNWIPFSSIYEHRLLNELAGLREESIRKLNFGQAPEDSEMVALLPRHHPKPLALYIIPPRDESLIRADLETFVPSHPDLDVWIWNVASGEIPSLTQA